MDPDRLAQVIPADVRRPAILAAWVVAWLACLAVAAARLDHARQEFSGRGSSPRECRADGNSGPTEIDFGGQFLMGRMLATGHGRDLYRRQALWPTLWESFPASGESPESRESFPRHLRPPAERDKPLQHDAEALMTSIMGTDAAEWTPAGTAAILPLLSAHPFAAAALTAHAAETLTPSLVEAVNRPAVGGPLYPPVHAFWYAPLAWTNDPQGAYSFFQHLSVALTFTAGLAIRLVSRGRVWWPLATLAVLLFPGTLSGLDLGQNPVVTLNILLWGWVLVLRQRDGWAGVVWGLLAFKPVWALAFLVVPLVMGRWRMLLAMAATGAASILLTLPVVGVQTWFDWLAVGGLATETYNVNENWITLSRDLAGLVRRAAIDFSKPPGERDSPAIRRACALLLVVVLVTTVTAYRLRRTPGNVTGTAAGFLALGAYLCCYRFMYYDTLLALFPLSLLLADPRRLARGVYRLEPVGEGAGGTCSVNGVVATAVALLMLCDNVLRPLALEVTLTFGGLSPTPSTQVGGMPAVAPRVGLNTTIYAALDTWILLALWASLALTLLVRGDDGEPASGDAVAPPQGVECPADVGGAHQRLADEDRVDPAPLKHD